ncbi:hypothetical protein HAP48_0046365 [Bradyrhizobium septentrionale]|uniref:Uncharacterized protein n=1 Tax=Bradyrhizobium septentrionale TaxID=1404411 RepID=A0A974A3E6_9BRAD|nr:hypothetical protein [Bradyrhizobium septentrionale]UGY15841.1 hypothetical protein HAP48_0046365 [Bradyrhizobium septentrionale]
MSQDTERSVFSTKRASPPPNQKLKSRRRLALPACGLIRVRLLKRGASAVLPRLFSAQDRADAAPVKMRLDDFAALRFTAAHGQIAHEEKTCRRVRRRRR